mgnify:CR=1 FL=1
MPTPEELLELMIHEVRTGIHCMDIISSARQDARLKVLEQYKERLKQPWEVRSLQDYESRDQS